LRIQDQGSRINRPAIINSTWRKSRSTSPGSYSPPKRVPAAIIKEIIASLEGGALIAAPVHKGERGHPVGFGAALREELLALDGDLGARAVVDRHRDSVQLIECDDPGILFDVDRKSDIAR